MKVRVSTVLLTVLGAGIFLLAAGACHRPSQLASVTVEIPSGRLPNASVSGTVTYRERLALTPAATLILEIRDVSYADGPAPLVARQTISDPGQVPIEFRVEYNRDDIEPPSTYSIGARIIEADGRLAFINDTAYEVITRGNPNTVDMLLVLVEPPPDMMNELDADGSDWRTWVEVPVPVISANLLPNEAEHLLRVVYHQSTMDGCARPGNQEAEVRGFDIVVRLTLMQPPPTPWSIPCHEQVVELDTIEPIGAPLERGPTYRVIVNDQETTSFTLPRTGLGTTSTDESPIESAEVVLPQDGPPRYELHVVSGMPNGSSCSQFNGYEIRRAEAQQVNVSITYHRVTDPSIPCTADYPLVETIIPLGGEFESGVEYTVLVNSEITGSFVAR